MDGFIKYISFVIFMGLTMALAQEIKSEDLLNSKWRLTNYVVGVQTLPVEKQRKKDYYIFKENNQKEEMLYGKIVPGTWEYLPHGKFIMLYSVDKEIYVPFRIKTLSKNELRLIIFDINTMKMVTLVYQADR